VAAAELAQMAGAERVCVYLETANTGNVDLVTLALNLYTQGIEPSLDFSNINDVVRTVEYCNQLPIHPRHPYVGDLVFTSLFRVAPGCHQEGVCGSATRAVWEVPYLPIDPSLGRTYESIIGE